MGSKRKLADKILNFILTENPNTKYIYDLFGGGASISLNAIQQSSIKEVYYNELNTGVVELFKDVIENGVTDKYYQWVSREIFEENKNKGDWFGGFCNVTRSFGNKGKTYMYGPDKECLKYLVHKLIVELDEKALNDINIKFDCDIKINFHTYQNMSINKRRLKIVKILKQALGRDGEAQHLERVQHLEQVQHLTCFDKLHILNLSYENVEITTPLDETIIYIDPPYKNTATYQMEIDHDELTKYIKNSPYKIYVNSYEYDDFECVYEMEHRSILSATANNKIIEKIFTNNKPTLGYNFNKLF